MKHLLLLLSFLSISVFANQEIIAPRSNKNPTIKFVATGVSAELQKKISSNLDNCGWFQLSNEATTNYTLKINGSPDGKLSISITDLAGNVINKGAYVHDISPIPADWQNHRIVDEVIARVYNPKNKICASKIAFSGQRGNIKEIYTINFDGSGLTQETNYKTMTVEPSWSGDNRFISYTVYGKQSVNLIQKDMNTKQHRLISNFKGLNSSAAFHPTDLGKFVLTLSKDNNVDLFMMNVGNVSSTTALTKDSSIESSPSWGPGGTKICYVSANISKAGKLSPPVLYILDLSQKRAAPLFRDGAERVSPDWSKSSGLITYAKRLGREYAVAVCDPAVPNSEKIITKTAGDWEAPSWAPDGRHIICTRNVGGRSTMFIIDAVLGLEKELKILQNGSPIFSKISLPAWSSLF